MRAKIAIALLLMLLTVSQVKADTFDGVNLDSGYFITHKSVKNSPEIITATAGTTDSRVQVIKFAWFAPDGTLTRLSPKISLEESDTQYLNGSGSYPVYVAEDEHPRDFPGYLRVIAIFQDQNEATIETRNHKIAIRVELFNTVPEIQIVGTAGSVSLMVLGVALYIKRRSRSK